MQKNGSLQEDSHETCRFKLLVIESYCTENHKDRLNTLKPLLHEVKEFLLNLWKTESVDIHAIVIISAVGGQERHVKSIVILVLPSTIFVQVPLAIPRGHVLHVSISVLVPPATIDGFWHFSPAWILPVALFVLSPIDLAVPLYWFVDDNIRTKFLFRIIVRVRVWIGRPVFGVGVRIRVRRFRIRIKRVRGVEVRIRARIEVGVRRVEIVQDSINSSGDLSSPSSDVSFSFTSNLGETMSYLLYYFRHRLICICPIEMAMTIIDLPFDVVLPLLVDLKPLFVSESLVHVLGHWLHEGLEISRKCLSKHDCQFCFSF